MQTSILKPASSFSLQPVKFLFTKSCEAARNSNDASAVAAETSWHSLMTSLIYSIISWFEFSTSTVNEIHEDLKIQVLDTMNSYCLGCCCGLSLASAKSRAMWRNVRPATSTRRFERRTSTHFTMISRVEQLDCNILGTHEKLKHASALTKLFWKVKTCYNPTKTCIDALDKYSVHTGYMLNNWKKWTCFTWLVQVYVQIYMCINMLHSVNTV